MGLQKTLDKRIFCKPSPPQLHCIYHTANYRANYLPSTCQGND